MRRPLFPTAWSLAAVAVTVVVAGCSGSDGATGPVPTVPLGSAPSTDPAANAGGVDSGGVDSGGSDRDATEITATPRAVTATVRSGVLDGALTVELDAPDAGDPFGRFASCSGSRSVVGAYSVLVADPAGVVRSISVISNDPVDGPGIHDAAVRIEPFAGAPIAGQGTLTLNDGMTSGSYLAFAADGDPIEGEFECTGTEGPEVLAVGADDGVLDTVEVFALLRSGDDERVLALAVTSATNTGAECPGALGAEGPIIVRVDGDDSIGAITTFELTRPPGATMRLRAGAEIYEFADVELQLDDGSTSGSFSAVGADGLAVDGAFRCT